MSRVSLGRFEGGRAHRWGSSETVMWRCWSSASPQSWPYGRTGSPPPLRGRHYERLGDMASRGGSPPRARGRRWSSAISTSSRGFTPACAGPPFLVQLLTCGHGVHPRVRGGRPSSSWRYHRGLGSPPRARGPPEIRSRPWLLGQFTPARAGAAPSSADSACSGSPPPVRGHHGDDLRKDGLCLDHPRLAGPP